MAVPEVLIALRGGPLDGRVVTGLRNETAVQLVETTVFGVRTHIYIVDVSADEISEAKYDRTFPGILR